MSDKKNLLNEGQVRQFMKLAKLEPLSPGFVHGLTERGSKAGDEGSVADGKKDDTDYSGGGERKGDKSKTHAGKDLEEGTEEELDETHGRGMNDPGYGADNTSPGRRVKVAEGEAGPGELEDFAADDLADDSLEGDVEAADDELEADAELGDPAATGGRMVSVDDFLAALEGALEAAMGDEVEVDATEMDVEEPPLEDEAELEVGDVEVEDEMMQENDKEEDTTEATDELVEQITKRVAARILKSAFTKK